MDNHCFLTGIFSIILILIVFPVQNIFSEQLFLLKFEAKAKPRLMFTFCWLAVTVAMGMKLSLEDGTINFQQ